MVAVWVRDRGARYGPPLAGQDRTVEVGPDAPGRVAWPIRTRSDFRGVLGGAAMPCADRCPGGRSVPGVPSLGSPGGDGEQVAGGRGLGCGFGRGLGVGRGGVGALRANARLRAFPSPMWISRAGPGRAGTGRRQGRDQVAQLSGRLHPRPRHHGSPAASVSTSDRRSRDPARASTLIVASSAATTTSSTFEPLWTTSTTCVELPREPRRPSVPAARALRGMPPGRPRLVRPAAPHATCSELVCERTLVVRARQRSEAEPGAQHGCPGVLTACPVSAKTQSASGRRRSRRPTLAAGGPYRTARWPRDKSAEEAAVRDHG